MIRRLDIERADAPALQRLARFLGVWGRTDSELRVRVWLAVAPPPGGMYS